MWLTSPVGKFLKGRFVWAAWDINELKSKRVELQKEIRCCLN